MCRLGFNLNLFNSFMFDMTGTRGRHPSKPASHQYAMPKQQETTGYCVKNVNHGHAVHLRLPQRRFLLSREGSKCGLSVQIVSTRWTEKLAKREAFP